MQMHPVISDNVKAASYRSQADPLCGHPERACNHTDPAR